MKLRAFVWAIVCAVIIIAPLHAAGVKKQAGSAASQESKSGNEIPKAEIKTIDLPDGAESEMQSEQADREKFRKDVVKVFEVPANATTLQKGSIQKAQQEAFLKSYNGKDICLRFPIEDIRPAGPGVYWLSKKPEHSPDLFPECPIVKLSASEAEWVSKGDCITVRGKARFTFERTNMRPSITSFRCIVEHGNNTHLVYMVLEKPEVVIVRVKHGSSLNDKIKARAAEPKTTESKEAEARKAEQRREEKAASTPDAKAASSPALVATWQHHFRSSNGGIGSREIRLYADGHADSPEGAYTWERHGSTLIIRKKDGTVITVTVSKDGRSYAGRNSKGLRVWGNLVEAPSKPAGPR